MTGEAPQSGDELPVFGVRVATSEDTASVLGRLELAIGLVEDARGGAILAARARRHELAEVVRSAIASERSTVLLGTLDDQVWGQTLVSLEELDEGVLARVDQLWVDPEARNIGLGRTMMLAAVTWARSADCVGIDAAALPGDRSTKNFFESFGLVARELIVHTGLGDHADI